MKSESSPEVKFIDTTVNANASDAGGVVLVNACIEGTDAINRIGRKIELTSVEYDLLWSNSLTNLGTAADYPTASDTLRVSLVYDRQPNGAAAAYTDVYSAPASIVAPFAHRNINNLDRFEVLATDLVVISAGGPNAEKIHRYIKTKHDVRFNAGNAGTIADIQSGSLFIMFIDQNTNTFLESTLVGSCRVRFHDM